MTKQFVCYIINMEIFKEYKMANNTEELINADINNDGKVNMTDIIKLRKYFAGLEDIK